jgi:hypothetical protein
MTGLSAKLLAEREAKLDALGPRPPWWQPFARRRWRRRRDAILAMDVSVWAENLRRWYPAARVQEMAAVSAASYARESMEKSRKRVERASLVLVALLGGVAVNLSDNPLWLAVPAGLVVGTVHATICGHLRKRAARLP